jgi:hypothetical protein
VNRIRLEQSSLKENKMASLKDLFKLTVQTHGETNKIAHRILLDALNRLDWKKLDGNLLEPLAAIYETLPENPALDGYKSLLMKTSDYCCSLQKEAEKVPLLQEAFNKLHQEHENLKKSIEVTSVKISSLITSDNPAVISSTYDGQVVISSPPSLITTDRIISCNNPAIICSSILNSTNQVIEVKCS